MTIKLLLIDLDDTLLGGDLEISAANREALMAAARRGVQVTLASGRMFQSMRAYAESLGVTLPLIAYNGALARPLAGSDLWHEPLANATAQTLLSRLAALDVTVNLYLDDRLYVEKLDPRALAYAANARVEAESVGELTSFLTGRQPTKLLAVGAPTLLSALRSSLGLEFADRAEITTSKPNYLEMTAPGISKAKALARLTEHLGLTRSETMAIGDGPNDLSMLLQAGIGVAVGNAAPEVLAGVEHIVAPSDRDGVAEAVRRFIL